MSTGLAYWVGMFLWLVLGLWSADWKNLKANGGNLLLFILLTLIGWKVWGPPIHD